MGSFHSIADQQHDPTVAVAELDITREICPMTFVRTRLALDRLPPGGLLRVRLKGEEPLRNVPRTAAAQGHGVLAVTPQPDGATIVVIRRG